MTFLDQFLRRAVAIDGGAVLRLMAAPKLPMPGAPPRPLSTAPTNRGDA